jgi:hypothetical protein
MIHRFARWHDDTSLPKVGIVIEDTLVVHHVLHGLLGLTWKWYFPFIDGALMEEIHLVLIVMTHLLVFFTLH